MRRRPGHRVLSALLGLWFVLAGQEPPFAHPCFMVPRGIPQARGHVDAHAHDASAPADAHATHAGRHDAEHGAEHGSAPGSPAPQSQCECIGECGALAPMPSVPLARQVLCAPPELRVVPAPLVAHVERVPAAPARVQPFANGPPDQMRA